MAFLTLFLLKLQFALQHATCRTGLPCEIEVVLGPRRTFSVGLQDRAYRDHACQVLQDTRPPWDFLSVCGLALLPPLTHIPGKGRKDIPQDSGNWYDSETALPKKLRTAVSPPGFLSLECVKAARRWFLEKMPFESAQNR